MAIFTKTISTPVGNMIAAVNDAGIYQLDYEHRRMMPVIRQRVQAYYQEEFIPGEHAWHQALEQQLDEYFKGTRTQFDLPVLLAGSSFQQKVWQLLLHIPYGKTSTYKQQSIAYGDERAIRAVASANGANTHAILIPCHRVISTNGALTGYAGGLAQKKWLLQHELRHRKVNSQASLF